MKTSRHLAPEAACSAEGRGSLMMKTMRSVSGNLTEAPRAVMEETHFVPSVGARSLLGFLLLYFGRFELRITKRACCILVPFVRWGEGGER